MLHIILIPKPNSKENLTLILRLLTKLLKHKKHVTIPLRKFILTMTRKNKQEKMNMTISLMFLPRIRIEHLDMSKLSMLSILRIN